MMDINQEASVQTNVQPPPRNFILQTELAKLFGITPQAAHMWMKHNKIESFRFTNKTGLTCSSARLFLEKREIRIPREVIAFQMLKGGSTKTSSAFNLAIRLNQYGARVLAVDYDMQGNLTDAFGVEPNEDTDPVMIHVMKKEAKIEDAIKTISEGLDLIPSGFENSRLDIEIAGSHVDLRTFVLKTLSPIRDKYDFVIIDCNPSLSALNISIALASDRIIIPVNPDKFSRTGLKKTLEELDRVSNEYAKDIKYNLLFTLFDARESTSQNYLIDYGQRYPGKLISTIIRRNADVKNAIDRKQSIFDIKNAPAREDFDLFAQEILGIRDLLARVNN